MLKHQEANERVSLYIPKRMYRKIDTERADTPRNKFILRILEQYFTGGVRS